MKRLISSFAALAVMLLAIKVYAGINISPEQGDKVSVFEDITVSGANTGDIAVIFGDALIRGDVNGDVVSVFGDAYVDSRVEGDVISVFGKAELSGNAVVQGDVVAVGTLIKNPGARVSGEEILINSSEFDEGLFSFVSFMIIVVQSFIILVIGMILITLFKDKFKAVSITGRQQLWKNIAVGFAILIAANVLSTVLIVTVFVPLLYICLIVLAAITSSIFCGDLLIRAFSSNENIYLRFITGLFTITLIKILLIHLIIGYNIFLGIGVYLIFSMLVTSLGLGTALSLRKSIKKSQETA
jgi:hypothetical protein